MHALTEELLRKSEEPLEKASKNVKANRNYYQWDPEGRRRMKAFIYGRLGLEYSEGRQDRFGIGPNQRKMTYNPDLGNPFHEAAHALMTPVGSTLRQYQQALGQVSSQVEMPRQERINEEYGAFTMEPKLARRAGMSPIATSLRRGHAERFPEQVAEGHRRANEHLSAIEEGRKAIDPKGKMVAGQSIHAKINARALGKSEADLHPLTKSLLDGGGSLRYLSGMNIAELRKDIQPQQPNVSVPAGQEDWPTTKSGTRHPPHPAYHGGHVAILSAEDPHSDPDADATGGNAQLAQDLKAAGLKFEPSRGKYGTVENGFTVHNPPEELMLRLAHKYGQESVVFSRGGKHKLVNVNGNSAGMAVHGMDRELHDTEPDDFYTTIWHPNGQPTHFTYNLDWENGVQPHPLPPGLTPKPPRKTTVAV